MLFITLLSISATYKLLCQQLHIMILNQMIRNLGGQSPIYIRIRKHKKHNLRSITIVILLYSIDTILFSIRRVRRSTLKKSGTFFVDLRPGNGRGLYKKESVLIKAFRGFHQDASILMKAYNIVKL
uniref:Uncharacterized protein n=1 Tax=Glossina brevipalpis TaxID=37001 RepID=A0A1A9W0A6_9MUSC